MLLWPPVAVGAVLLDATLAPGLSWRDVKRVSLAAAASWGLSLWVIVMAALQLHGHTANINWIEPLDIDDFVSSLNLQLLLGGTTGSLAMLALAAIGATRTIAQRETRLSLLALILAVGAFKACDYVHPIISDFTLHWAALFTTLLAAAALSQMPAQTLALRRGTAPLARLLVLAAVAALGPWALANEAYIPRPQD
jgi:type IV secretory pathway VirB2 component (pilin)